MTTNDLIDRAIEAAANGRRAEALQLVQQVLRSERDSLREWIQHAYQEATEQCDQSQRGSGQVEGLDHLHNELIGYLDVCDHEESEPQRYKAATSWILAPAKIQHEGPHCHMRCEHLVHFMSSTRNRCRLFGNGDLSRTDFGATLRHPSCAAAALWQDAPDETP